jgi:hypothetical protein
MARMRSWTKFGWFLVGWSGLCHADPAKVVGLLCYPSDELIRESCEKFRAQMKACGTKVVTLDDFSGDLTNEQEKKRAADLLGLPPSAPIFISSHGNSFGGKHYLGSSKGDIAGNTLGPHDEWKVPDSFDLSEEKVDAGSRFFATDRILAAVEGRPRVLSACFAGRACESGKPKLDLIASCAPNETSDHAPAPGGGSQEPVLYWVGQLYCDPKAFGEADTSDPKGELSEKELGIFLAKKMGGKKTLPVVYYSKTPNVDPKDAAALKLLVTLPPKTAEVRIVDSSRIEAEAKAKARALGGTAPHLKTSVEKGGDMMEVSWGEGKGANKELLPGYFSNQYTAKAAARALLEARGVKDAPFRLAVVGSAYEVIVEDTHQACRVGGLSLEQTPLIQGKIKPLPESPAHDP